MRMAIKILAGVGVAAFVCFAILMWQLNRPPFAFSRLELLSPGMTTNEVAEILGSPRGVYVSSNSAAQPVFKWIYSRTLSWPIVTVYFHSNGTFDRHEYDY